MFPTDLCVVRAVPLDVGTGHQEAHCTRVANRDTGNGRTADRLRTAATFLQDTIIVGKCDKLDPAAEKYRASKTVN